MAIDKELLEILACPKCKGPIELQEDGKGLTCDTCRLRYRIEDDIPIMLIDEAEEI
ncbi:MAG: Trm112 family protein [bacterium]|nr:MAG: Trm112 family protein [bacterium]